MNSISILGCGWFGLPLGERLVKAGYEVKGSTTHSSKISLLEKAGISPYLIHLTPTLEDDPRDFFSSDVLLVNIPPRNQHGITNFHENQLKAVQQAASSNTKHIIFISSTAVYPAANKEVFESDASDECLTRGGVSLLKMENIFSRDSSFKTTVVRFGGLYGPYRHPGKFLSGQKQIAGPDNPVNMIHLDDCTGVIETLLQKNIWGEVFNACSPKEETRASFYRRAAIEIGEEAPSFSSKSLAYKKVNSDKLVQMSGYQFVH